MLFVAFDEKFEFPPVENADEDGLLLIGGELSPSKVMEAYRKGIFPWYNEGEPVLWWSPDPRFVLFPEELHVSRSMQKVFWQNKFEFKTNTAFDKVIAACKSVKREGQDGTWITDEMEAVYIELHRRGLAYSAEAWHNNELVGGMYGIRMGKIFCGESMFSKMSNASKFVFITYVQELQKEGVKLIDCQVQTNHLTSLGARAIPRKDFIDLLKQLL